MADTEKLILLVEKNECIWKNNTDEYLNKHMKEKAWEEIANELYSNYNDMSLKEKQAVGK